MELMESSEAYAPSAHPPLPGPVVPAPLARLGESPLPSGRDPFGEPPRPQRTIGNLRRRISGALAAAAAVIAKFFAAIKGLLLLIPKLKLLTTAGTALVSVAAYSLWVGWTFANGLCGR